MLKHRIIVGTNQWNLSGVNTYAAHLVRGFIKAGHEAEVLLTNDPIPAFPQKFPVPTDIPFKELRKIQFGTWNKRWRLLRKYLTEHAPCIYLPNQDRAFSCASSMLPDSVKVVGVAHSDEEYHYEHLSRMGPHWNAIVCVSKEIEDVASQRYPSLKDKIVTITNSVPAPTVAPRRSPSNHLRIIYAGRLRQYQKRIFDLVSVVAALYGQCVPFSLTIAGIGDDGQELRTRISDVDRDSRVSFVGSLSNEQVISRLREHDVFILTSEFEGLPMGLLEAMAQGCIPVVSAIKSGVLQLIESGKSGLVFPIGDIGGCVKHLKYLSNNTEARNTLSANAHQRVSQGEFSLEHQVNSYIRLFDSIHSKNPNKPFQRMITGKAIHADYFDPTLKGEFKRSINKLRAPIK